VAGSVIDPIACPEDNPATSEQAGTQAVCLYIASRGRERPLLPRSALGCRRSPGGRLGAHHPTEDICPTCRAGIRIGSGT